MPTPSTTWPQLRKALATLDPKSLDALLRQLHDANSSNREMILRACKLGDGAELMEECREKICKAFSPRKLDLASGRAAIRDYTKATKDLKGTANLLLFYVEEGTTFTRHYGDIDSRFYNSLESALKECVKLLRDKLPGAYPEFRERFLRLVLRSEKIGWGYHDAICDLHQELEQHFNPQ
jgi:hypothetical protein